MSEFFSSYQLFLVSGANGTKLSVFSASMKAGDGFAFGYLRFAPVPSRPAEYMLIFIRTPVNRKEIMIVNAPS